MKAIKKYFVQSLALIIIAGYVPSISAQDWKTEKKFNVLFGLAQPVLASGFNIEGNFVYHRLIIDYSHGASLDFSGNLVPADLRKQQLAIHEPWTTGFGIGYRLKEWINVRVEPKWHRFEYYYEGETQTSSNMVTAYNTFSLGLGIYGAYQPFKHRQNFLKGFLVAPSIRYWPTVHSGLVNDSYAYLNKNTHSMAEIKTLDPGTGFTPFVFNISLGYSFSFKKKS